MAMKIKDGTRKLYLISSYSTRLFELNDDDMCIKGTELISIEDAVVDFKNAVKPFEVIKAYVQQIQILNDVEVLPEIYFKGDNDKWVWNVVKRIIW